MEKTRIPDGIIDTIRSQTDIISLISGYFPLKRMGNSYKAICPFHQEKTPSFVVSASKQIFHCFGCGAGGDAIHFLMKYETLNFYEAVKKLAGQLNIELPASSDNKENNEIDRIKSIVATAESFYNRILIDPKQGKTGLDYFYSRKITDNTIEEFNLGYAPDKWDTLMTAAQKKGYTQEELVKSGMIIFNRDKNNYYDRFRNRVLFPIHNSSGAVIGFGGRVLDDGLPKYINSPENTLFNKSKNLYGLDKSKKFIIQEKQVIIFEGYMDFLRAYQEGVKNIVATLGTALTKDHALILKRFTNNILMIFDSDQAGISAAIRSIEIFLSLDFNIKLASVKNAKDPDEFIQKFGAQEFKNYIAKNAVDFFDYKINLLSSQEYPSQEEKKTQIASVMFETLDVIENNILKNEYLKKLSKILDIDQQVLISQFKKSKLKNKKASFNKISEFKKHSEPSSMLEEAEKTILKILLEKNEFYDKIYLLIKRYNIAFSIKALNSIWNFILQNNYKNFQALFTHLDDNDLKQYLSQLIVTEINTDDIPKIINDCFKIIILAQIEKNISGLINQQEQALKDNKQEWEIITNKIINLKKEKINIYKKGVYT